MIDHETPASKLDRMSFHDYRNVITVEWHHLEAKLSVWCSDEGKVPTGARNTYIK